MLLNIFSTVWTDIDLPSEVKVSDIFFIDRQFPMLSNINLDTVLT